MEYTYTINSSLPLQLTIDCNKYYLPKLWENDVLEIDCSRLVGDESHKVNVFELNLDPAGTGAYISGGWKMGEDRITKL